MSCPSTSSDRLTSDTAVVTGSGRVTGLLLEGDGTNAASVVLYDGTSAAGTILYKLLLKASSNDLCYPGVLPEDGIVFNNGLYADLTGTGAACIVHYIKS